MFSSLRQPKSFYRWVLRLALPVALQNLITSSLGFMDTFMVGLLGSEQMSAVSVANVPIFIMQLIVFGLQSGSTVLISQYWGKGDRDAINRVLGIGLGVVGAVAGVMALVLGLFPAQVLSLVTNNPVLIELGAPYLRIVGVSYFFTGVSSIYIGMQRSTENVRFGTVVLAASTLCNTVGNYILIFGKLGAPRLGVRGAAIATLASRVLEVVICITYALRSKRMPLRPRCILRPGKSMLRTFLKYSAPVLINETLWGIGYSMNTVIMGHMEASTELIAAYTFCRNVEQIIAFADFGLGAAAAVIIGKEIGMGEKARAREIGTAFSVLSMLISAAFSVVELLLYFTVLKPYLLPLFKLSAASVGFCTIFLLARAFAAPLGTHEHVVIVGVLRGGGDVRAAMLMDVLPLWLGALPLLTLMGIVWKVPLALFCVGVSTLEMVLKFPPCYHRLSSGKWVHDVTEDVAAK